jgi:hypothetical protein
MTGDEKKQAVGRTQKKRFLFLPTVYYIIVSGHFYHGSWVSFENDDYFKGSP